MCCILFCCAYAHYRLSLVGVDVLIRDGLEQTV